MITDKDSLISNSAINVLANYAPKNIHYINLNPRILTKLTTNLKNVDTSLNASYALVKIVEATKPEMLKIIQYFNKNLKEIVSIIA